MTTRTADVSFLHPAYRARSLDLEARARAANLPIRRYEGWRDPARQADLWAFGRVSSIGTPGRHKTFEQSWQSSHQWGFAEDWVWWTPAGGWSWDPPAGASWAAFGAIATAAGLERLSFEQPHVQLPGFNARKALAGEMASVLAGGDFSWQTNLEAALTAWGPLPRKDAYGVVQPGVPNIFDERPAAPVPAGYAYDEERGLCLAGPVESGPDLSGDPNG
jgi:peptidoglycan L-alanyl-D-glutamate endopeptidase CwlK